MKAQVNFDSLGGGGSYKEGTEDNTTSASQTVTINTGLSSISKFFLTSDGIDSGDTYEIYYTSDNSSYYFSAMMRTSTMYGGIAAIGNAPAVQAWKVTSINNGVVTLASPSNDSHGKQTNISWLAI